MSIVVLSRTVLEYAVLSRTVVEYVVLSGTVVGCQERSIVRNCALILFEYCSIVRNCQVLAYLHVAICVLENNGAVYWLQ